MILIKLQGGLGNQMFQYAFAGILAKKNNQSLVLDQTFFNLTEKKNGFTPRKFELDIFKNVYYSASSKDLRSFHYLSLFDKIKKRTGFNYPKIYEEVFFGFRQSALSIKAPAYIKGYFQSYKYLIGFEDFVKKVFSFPLDILDDINKNLLLTIKSSTTISIHVRRGDYVNDTITQQVHGNCSVEYYKNAIEFLASKNKDFTLIFFSDDIDWVKEQFRGLPYSKIFIDHNNEEDSWKDMLLMSSCSHNIIANSSFSWWAAWLNGNPEKTIIAPKLWFAEIEKNTNDLIPSQWIRL